MTDEPMARTVKQSVEISGRSESWLRRHECLLCGQTALRALMYGCGAIWDGCNPADRDYSATAKREEAK